MMRGLMGTIPALLAVGLAAGAVRAEEASAFGRPGEPVVLRVGYQPLYAEGWTALVIEGKQLWKTHLPAGSKVEFSPAAAGGALISQMVAGRLQVAYVGDMPALLASSRPDLYDIRMVAVAGRSQQQCNVLLVRKDAPDFASPEAAVRWTDGKVVGTPHGSCADRFSRAVMARYGAKPEKYFNYGIDALAEKFKAGQLDAAAVWEPAASRLVAEGLARRVATGADFGESDAAVVIMPNELRTARPDVAQGWLATELAAQAWLADPTHADEVVAMAAAKLPNYSKDSLWQALYGGSPQAVKVSYDFAFSPQLVEHLGKSLHFLADLRRAVTPDIRSDAIADAETQATLKAAGLTMPVGVLRGQLTSNN